MPYKEPISKMWTWVVHGIAWLTAFMGALTLEKVALIVGIVTSLGAFVVNCYVKYRHAKVVEEIARQKKDCALCDRVNRE